MSNKHIEKWKQKGHLYLWHYLENERNYPGWHLSADRAFCNSFSDLIERMLLSSWISQKLIALTTPTMDILRIPNNRGGNARWYTKNSLLIKCGKDSGKECFDLEEKDDLVTILASSQNLIFLQTCVTGIFQGKNDYSIEIGEKRLWFW